MSCSLWPVYGISPAIMLHRSTSGRGAESASMGCRHYRRAGGSDDGGSQRGGGFYLPPGPAGPCGGNPSGHCNPEAVGQCHHRTD